MARGPRHLRSGASYCYGGAHTGRKRHDYATHSVHYIYVVWEDIARRRVPHAGAGDVQLGGRSSRDSYYIYTYLHREDNSYHNDPEIC